MLKRILLVIIVLLSSNAIFATDKYFTRKGHIDLVSRTDIIDLPAENNQVACIVNIKTGEMVFSLLMRSFIFEEALAQDHFNENYAETDTYPKSKFKGKITNIKEINLSKDGKYKAIIEGNLTIHGVTKKVKTIGSFEVKNNKIYGKAKFDIDIFDYNIKIPKIVKDKVNNIIPLNISVVLEPYKK